jgi:RHS repeat-associated protein
VVERYRYTAFGQPTILNPQSSILASSAYGNRFAFQGREWFAELNLTDHRNRYYSPELNRWLNRDPIEEMGGINLYAYVNQDPADQNDPDGFDCTNNPPTTPPLAKPPVKSPIMPPWNIGPITISGNLPPKVSFPIGGGWNGTVSGNPIKGVITGTASGPLGGGWNGTVSGGNNGKGGWGIGGGISHKW